jgi:hypothetical protein
MAHWQVVVGTTADVVADYGVEIDGGPITVLLIKDDKIVSVDEWNDLERAKAAYEWGSPDTDSETYAYLEL